MTTKFLALISVIALVGTCLVQAQSPTRGESPAASPSPAKHRTHKKAGATASPAESGIAFNRRVADGFAQGETRSQESED